MDDVARAIADLRRVDRFISGIARVNDPAPEVLIEEIRSRGYVGDDPADVVRSLVRQHRYDRRATRSQQPRSDRARRR